jgi:hypothetical protein
LRVDDPPEHIVPAAIGGTLTTDRACFACNQRASGDVDQPFVREWPIVLARNEFQILDRRGKRPPRLPQETTAEDGTRLIVETWGGPWEPKPLPEVTRTADGFVVSAADDAELDRIQRDLERKLGYDGKTLTPGERQRRDVAPQVEARFVFRPAVWLRMAAKMALGTASLVWDDAWLDTQSAKDVQQTLWDPNPRMDDGEPAEMVPAYRPNELAHLCDPPEHLLFFMGGADETKFVAMLFGSEVIGMPLALNGQSHPRVAWLMDGHGGAPCELTMDQLLEDAARRAGLIP